MDRLEPKSQINGFICSTCFHNFDDDCYDVYDNRWILPDDFDYDIGDCECVLCGPCKLGERYPVYREES